MEILVNDTSETENRIAVKPPNTYDNVYSVLSSTLRSSILYTWSTPFSLVY
jgi:hypothetical protein